MSSKFYRVQDQIVDVVRKEMRLKPELIAQRGADMNGYYKFVLDENGKRVIVEESKETLLEYVQWTSVQLMIISKHQEIFNVWFECGEE